MSVSFGGDGRKQGEAASMLATVAEITSAGGIGYDTPMKEMHRKLRQVGEIVKNER